MKYISLADTIRDAINRGQFKSGKSIPDTLTLSRQYMVSSATVDRAVQLLASEGWVRRIKSKGTFVENRQSSDILSQMRNKRVAFLFHGTQSGLMQSHFAAQAFIGVEKILKESGKSVILLPNENRSNETYIRLLEAEKVSGVLVYAFYNNSLLEALKRLKMPRVFLDYVDFGLHEHQITSDHARAGAIALQKLVELGHQRVLFLGHADKNGRRDPDHDLWVSATNFEARTLKMARPKIHFLSFENRNTMLAQVRKLMLQYGDCTGYICASTTFYDLCREVAEHEPTLPKAERDCVLFADWREPKQFCGKPLWQCRWDTKEMGITAARVLLSLMDGGPHKPQMHYLPVEIISS